MSGKNNQASQVHQKLTDSAEHLQEYLAVVDPPGRANRENTNACLRLVAASIKSLTEAVKHLKVDVDHGVKPQITKLTNEVNDLQGKE